MFLADLRLVTIVVLFFFGNNTYIESPIPWAYILAAMFSMPAALKEGTGRNRTREAYAHTQLGRTYAGGDCTHLSSLQTPCRLTCQGRKRTPEAYTQPLAGSSAESPAGGSATKIRLS